MLKCFKSDCLWCFGIGAVAGAVALTAAKTPCARNLAVKGLAKGMMAKDSVMEVVTNIQDEAEDICAEARAVAKAKSEGDCDCDDCQCDCTCDEVE